MVPRPDPLTATPAVTDRECFARARVGDVDAFEVLFRRYVDQLCAFALVYTQSNDSAEEVVQELFIWLWEHRTAIEPPRSVAAYLHAAVRNRALNQLRDGATELRIYHDAIDAGGPGAASVGFAAPDLATEGRDLSDALGGAVAGLPVRCREVFTLARTKHLTYAEIADVLGISPKTVEIHMSRALAILRQRLAPWLAG